MGAGGSPARSPLTGSSPPSTRRPPHPQVPRAAPRWLPRARGHRAGDRDHHRRGTHQGRRDRKRRPGCRRAVCCAEAVQATLDGQQATGTTGTPVLGRQWYGDSAYGTGELRQAIAKAEHVAVLKPKPLQPAVAGGFTVDDFTVDEAACTVTCPNGLTRPITPSRNVVFGVACRHCPLRQRCTTSTSGRTLTLHPHDGLLRQARRHWAANPQLRDDYRQHRPNVERVISQLASRGGRRLKLRYLGTANNNAWLKRRTAALNLRNLIGRGLAHRHGTWTLGAASGALREMVRADAVALGQTEATFQFFCAFAHEVTDGFGRLLCFLNRQQATTRCIIDGPGPCHGPPEPGGYRGDEVPAWCPPGCEARSPRRWPATGHSAPAVRWPAA
jgi:hypothetical protein